MQAGNSNSNDRDTRLAKQQEMITSVVRWLREEEIEPEEITHKRKDASYFATFEVDSGEAVHVLFRTNRLDSIVLLEFIALDEETQKSYASLSPVRQNKFIFDLTLALLQRDVFFVFRKNIRELQTVEVQKFIFFDGLTKDRFFDSIFKLNSAFAIAGTLLNQLRDEILPSKAGRTEDRGDLR